MVIHGGGPGLRFPRKRVELGNVMWMQEDLSIGSWNNDKVTESKDLQGFDSEILNSTLERQASPPLRTGDDFEYESEEQNWPDSGNEALNGDPAVSFNLNSSREPNGQSVDGVEEEVADSKLREEQPVGVADDVDMNLDEFFTLSSQPNGQSVDGVEEEVADSKLREEQPVGVADDVDMSLDEFFILLGEEKPLLTEAVVPRMSQLGTELALASSPRFHLQVPEALSAFSRAIGGNNVAFPPSGNLDLQRLAQQMEDDDDDDDARAVGPSQESTHSQPLMTTHNFMLSPPTRQASQSGIVSDSWEQFDRQADIFSLGLNHNENSRHSDPMGMETGNVARENPFGSTLHLSILDNDAEDSVNTLFRGDSRTVDHTLSLQPSYNIDHDRPSQNSGSVLASEVKLPGSIHTFDRMATPPSAGVALRKQVSSSKDPIALSSDSDSDDDGFFISGQSLGMGKRRAQDSLAGFNGKRPHLLQGSSKHAEWSMYAQKLNGSNPKRPFEWHQGQFHLENWRTQPGDWKSQPHQWNTPGAVHLPSRDTSHSLDTGMDGGGSLQYAESSVEINTTRGNVMQLSAAYDLNVKSNLQVARTVPATAQSIMKDTLAGNNNDEDLPPEGHLAVPLLKHQRVALAWMKKRELGGLISLGGGIANETIVQGGILADDQGLGKTISTISLILRERAPIKKVSTKTLRVDVLDADDDSHVTGKAPIVLPAISENLENGVPLQPIDSGISSSARNPQPDVVTVSSKFRPAAGTLVVCPTSVLRQWAAEIKEKVTEKAGLTVLIYHGSNRTRDPEELVKFDVVLTTYSIVSMEVPKQPPPEEKDDKKNCADDGPPPFRAPSKPKKPKKALENGKQKRRNGKGRLVEGENGSVDSGPLARVNWFRVVLDEAQSIKNPRTQGARAVWGLRSKRRWCLSGTPIQNAIDDLYSYFRFLRYSPFDSYKKFRELVKDPVTRTPTQGYANLLKLLTPVMLRRTKATKIDGQPIVNLPERIVNLRQAEFSEEERAFYNNLENESRKQFQDYAAAGTLQSNYVNILWMLLRLRQACDHPLLVKGHHYKSSQKVSPEVAMKLPAEKRMLLLSLLEGNRDICPICSDIPDEAVVCVCGHVFCRQCISEQLATGDDTCCPVPKCRKSLNTSFVFTLASLKLSAEGSSVESTPVLEGMVQEAHSAEAVAWKSSSKIDAVIDTLNALPPVSGFEVKDDVIQSSDNLEASKSEDPSNTRDLNQEPPTAGDCGTESIVKVEPILLLKREVGSAGFESIPDMLCKESTVKLEDCVSGQADMLVNNETVTKDEFLADTTGLQVVVSSDVTRKRTVLTEKAIVFSQWTSMLDLLEAKLKEAKFNYRRLDGTMSVLARDRAVSEFKTIPEVNVIIMSLKAASLGLNMVAACHVLLLDVWWNPTTEDQAIDRAHRIGQTRPVKVSRFTVKNTIEDRILELQEKKRHMVSSAFGENGSGGGNGHLSAAELNYLFNGQDRPFNG